MGKTRVRDFDASICRGDHPAVNGPCPHLVGGDADTGHGLVDHLARLEAQAIEAATGSDAGKCGLCGCPLPNLGAVNAAPEDCPRLRHHDS